MSRRIVATVLAVLAAAFTACERGTASGSALAKRITELEGQLAANRVEVGQLRSHEFLRKVETLPGQRTVLTVLKTSRTPHPATSDYDDCVEVSIARVIKSEQPGLRPGQELQLMSLAFQDRRFVDVRPAVGLPLHARLIVWPAMPDDIRSIQRADTTDRFDLDRYAATDLRLEDTGELVAFEPYRWRTPPADRPSLMAQDLTRWESLLVKHGGFESWCAEAKPFVDSLSQRVSAVKPELLKLSEHVILANAYNLRPRRVGSRWPVPQLTVLRSLRDQLRNRGIDLIVAPFPTRSHVNAPLFLETPPDDGVLDPARVVLLGMMLREDIEVIDLLPALRAASANGMRVFHDCKDVHPAIDGIDIAARAIADRLRRYNFEPTIDQVFTKADTYAILPRFTLTPDREYPSQSVLGRDRKPVWGSAAGSPILIVSDSFGYVPHMGCGKNSPGSALPSHVAKYTRIKPKRLAAGSGGPKVLQLLAGEEREFLRGVRVCVFLCNEADFYRNSSVHEWRVAELPK